MVSRISESTTVNHKIIRIIRSTIVVWDAGIGLVFCLESNEETFEFETSSDLMQRGILIGEP